MRGNENFFGIRKPRLEVSSIVSDGVKTRDLLVEDNAKIEDNAQINGTLTVNGATLIDDNLRVNGNITQYGYTLLPKFSVTMYSGTVASIPSGWLLCDGRTETINGVSVTAPNLSGRFVLSYGQGPLDFVNTTVGATGGAQNHTLSVNEIPSHSHTSNTNAPSVGLAQRTGTNTLTTSDSSGGELDLVNTTNLSIGNTGGGLPHNNMPPYYVLSYIMKGF